MTITRLYIAEKPSLARALANALPKPHKQKEGCIILANGDVISWCIGHLLEQAPPDFYDKKYQKWSIKDLPIVPNKWQLLPKENTKKQLKILISLIKKTKEIIHVGDPDREGQLLVDEVINYAESNKNQLKSIKRCLINDLNESAIINSLKSLKKNKEFIYLSISALARARADWLYGINMSRLCTLILNKNYQKQVYSIGRVQTPILGLVVKRDDEIKNFISKPYYEVIAKIKANKNEYFDATWQPSDACKPYQDDSKRVINKALAENVCTRIKDKKALIENITHKNKFLTPPLPLNLSTLQIEAAKKFNLSPQEVLTICQNLYEKYKLITYPRSDNRYLPQTHHAQAQKVTTSIFKNLAKLENYCKKADFCIKTKAWNDKKVEAHHAIIPTIKTVNFEQLTRSEINIYELIAIYYLAQFYQNYTYSELKIEVIIEKGLFISQATRLKEKGWKHLFTEDKNDNLNNLIALTQSIKKGDILHCSDAVILTKNTTSPKHFTDATLLSAITGIARFVEDKNIKKILRETDGLGTEATRAGIIELLFKRGFLIKENKNIKATELGESLINSLPKIMTQPDMTAHLESKLNNIYEKNMTYQHFIDDLINQIKILIDQIKN